MPSIDHMSTDGISSWYSHAGSSANIGPLEIRGVYGGRKRRYVIERAEGGSCQRECKEKVICLSVLGEFLNDCKCKKCPTGFPGLDGKPCAEKCPDGALIRQDSLKRLKELQEGREKEAKDRRDKITEANDKKKERMAKCNAPTALLMGATFNEAMSKRDGEHPYDWTTDYFDEDYITSDARLKDWPEDIDVEKISADVNTDAFLDKWDEFVDDHKRQGANCNFVGRRSLERRCSQKRALGDWLDDNILEALSGNVSSLILGSVTSDLIESMSHTPADLEKLNPIAWLFNLIAFGTRLGVSLVARASASVAARSPRLANLLKNPDRLFQTASKGQGTKAGQKGMESAKNAIKTDYKRWWKCLKEGMP